MRILHITPHLGGGIGSVVLDWVKAESNGHAIVCLDYINENVVRFCQAHNITCLAEIPYTDLLRVLMEQAEIVIVHYWDHPVLTDLFHRRLPPCRLVFWCHKNYPVSGTEVNYPDLFLDTSPIQSHGKCIRSTRDMTPFSAIKPQEHKGIVVGYVGTVDYKKLHRDFFEVCKAVDVPDIHFIMVGENNIGGISDEKFTFVGHTSELAPYYASFDIFGYPLRSDHYGTCEQVLGEAMCAGVIPVVLDNPAERMIINKTEHGIVATSKADYIFTIEELARCPKLRKSLSKRIRPKAKAYYSLDHMRQRWKKVFKRLMLQPKKARGGL